MNWLEVQVDYSRSVGDAHPQSSFYEDIWFKSTMSSDSGYEA